MKRNIIVISIVGLIVLYAYLSEKFSNRNKIDLSNYELNQAISKKIQNDVRDTLNPKPDSISIQCYEMKNNLKEKYIIGFLNVNRNFFFNDSLSNSIVTQFLDGVILTTKNEHFTTDIKFHYQVGGEEINRNVHLDFPARKKTI
ncbi:MAG: hypothetical protein ABI723_01230 [Bacteroidia bacterium]